MRKAMPELPEVETVARRLREGLGAPALVGRTIQSARVLWPREVGNMDAQRFEHEVAGLRVREISRHGKYLILTLEPVGQAGLGDSDGGQAWRACPTGGEASGQAWRACPTLSLLVHLRMSGRLDVVPQAEAFTKHARVVWLLDDDLALRFDDARKFGRVWLAGDPGEVTGRLGPDALQMSCEAFVASIRKKRGALKPVLLDQSFIAGVGNIYADESLHLAHLHPKRLADTLSEPEAAALYAAIQRVLTAGIAANGASFDWVYPGGHFQENFKVYGMTGKPCAGCGQPIERILVGQRSTHFCPACQPVNARRRRRSSAS
jgi:formamidopyrimidine-DNA glycosylase